MLSYCTKFTTVILIKKQSARELKSTPIGDIDLEITSDIVQYYG
jgi:hypothetical protein